MDPMTMAALANVALQVGGQIMNSGQQGDELAMRQRALAMQKENAKQQMDLATSTRTDAYGNKLIYTPGVGWHYDLTDMTRGTLASEQGEQLKSLTEDATRNRQQRQRAEGLSREGESELYNTLNEYRYGEKPNEAESIAANTRLGVLGNERGNREGANLVGRQAIRMNNSSLIPAILRQAAESRGNSLEEVMLRGRAAGKAEYRGDTAARDTAIGNKLSKFSNLFNIQRPATIQNPNIAENLQTQQSSAMTQAIQALQNAASGQSAAMSSMASTAGQPGFDMAALGPSILALGKQMQPAPAAVEPNYMDQQWWWDEGTRTIGNA